MEIEKMGEELVKDPERSLPSLLVVIDGLFSKLATSIGHQNATPQVIGKTYDVVIYNFLLVSSSFCMLMLIVPK